ncbi:MAG: recombinase family protein [Halobacteriaceae archaeon]
MLSESEVEGLRWVIMVRVSTGSQRDNQSLDQQEKQTDSERKRLNGDIVEQFFTAESGTTMDRETINKLIKMAENDEFDVLGIILTAYRELIHGTPLKH